jgi:hypothetical protein
VTNSSTFNVTPRLTVDVLGRINQPVVDPKFAAYSNSPLEGTSGSAIEAFIKFSGYGEVTQ